MGQNVSTRALFSSWDTDVCQDLVESDDGKPRD